MAKRSGLGKGLDALIPTTPQFESSGNSANTENSIQQIALDKIIPNPWQPRQAMDSDELDSLAASIKEHGVIQPLIVSVHPDEADLYILIAGERRLRASEIANLKEVPVIIRDTTEQEKLELALIENVQRENLAPLDTAKAYQQLNQDFNLSHDEIALRVGKSRVAITNTLRLLKLPPSVQNALSEEKISEGHARTLLTLLNIQAQTAALQTILSHQLSVRQTEELVRKLHGEKKAATPKAEKKPEIKGIEEQLRIALGTKVTLNHGKKGGTITLHYYSDEELNALIERFSEQ
ncbi:MAG: ParB/RepB/Spo0J family partition protein [Anaerolineaceae bacterium]|nr:ParB/RepB/Spo0J family partition protein [Anaerolineaceae bacterium]